MGTNKDLLAVAMEIEAGVDAINVQLDDMVTPEPVDLSPVVAVLEDIRDAMPVNVTVVAERGEPGPQGEQGIQGIPGEKGDPGVNARPHTMVTLRYNMDNTKNTVNIHAPLPTIGRAEETVHLDLSGYSETRMSLFIAGGGPADAHIRLCYAPLPGNSDDDFIPFGQPVPIVADAPTPRKSDWAPIPEDARKDVLISYYALAAGPSSSQVYQVMAEFR